MVLFFKSLLIYVILGGLAAVSGGFRDYPCTAYYDEYEDCIHTQERGDPSSRIEAFLTTYSAGSFGGGCLRKKSHANALMIETGGRNLTLEAQGETLRVNGRELPKGAELEFMNVFDWNPWLIYRMNLKNTGMVAECRSKDPRRRFVVLGGSGSEVSFLKGLPILLITIIGLVSASRKRRASKP